ncbi:MAG TPA: PadR family transcriptional regulator [Acidimicrobiales bacterium]|nr:PadR family transcriptional regulator [Acidimicrobiales bacterium]
MVKHVLLGLLQGRGRHGYELKAAFEELTGGTWPVNEGQIYATLSRLERDGLVVSALVEQELLPNRRVYELTPSGVLTLKRWLAEPADEPVQLKEEWFVKVLVQALVAPGEWAALVGAQRQAGLRRLAELQEVRDDPATSPITELVIEGALFQVEAGLRWLELCEERLGSPSANNRGSA